MNARNRILPLLALVALLGGGCLPRPSLEISDLPTTPPPDARGEVRADAEADIDAEDGSATTGSDASVDADASQDLAGSDDAPPAEGGSASTEDDPAPSQTAKPYYIAYSEAEFEAARAEGRPIVLYFWASWCPVCRAEEPKIIEDIENADVPIAGFRVNFDTETELKSEYKIPYQHTTVILDTEGNEVERFTGPVSTDERLRAFADAYAN